MAKKISVSFKETTKDTRLYMFINGYLEDKSSGIKKAISEYYKEEIKEFFKDEYTSKKESEEIKESESNNNLDILNF